MVTPGRRVGAGCQAGIRVVRRIVRHEIILPDGHPLPSLGEIPFRHDNRIISDLVYSLVLSIGVAPVNIVKVSVSPTAP